VGYKHERKNYEVFKTADRSAEQQTGELCGRMSAAWTKLWMPELRKSDLSSGCERTI